MTSQEQVVYQATDQALKSGNPQQISSLLKKHPDQLNSKDALKNLLIAASERGYLSAAKYLVTRGAQVNLVTSRGGTPLTAAVASHNVESVRFLLSKGASATFVSPQTGDTALHYLMGSAGKKEDFKATPAIATLLIGAKTKVDLPNHQGYTPLRSLVGLCQRASQNSPLPPSLLQTVSLLLEAGANPDTEDKYHNTARKDAKRYAEKQSSLSALEALFQSPKPPMQPTKETVATDVPATSPSATPQQIADSQRQMMMGEITLEGWVKSGDLNSDSITLLAARFYLPNKKLGDIKPYKEKQILLTPQTFISTLGNDTAQTVAEARQKGLGFLASTANGNPLWLVIGTDQGPGKPFAARRIIFQSLSHIPANPN